MKSNTSASIHRSRIPLALSALLLAASLSPAETPATAPSTQPVNTAVVPVPKLENDSYNWEARHQAVLDLQKTISPEVVMIGDSITHFWGGLPKAQQNGPKAWASLFGDHVVLNMGFGWDRTQNVLWRLDHGEMAGLTPRVVVLNIGTNNFSGTRNARENTPQEIAQGIDAIVNKIHTISPTSQIILMGVFPRGGQPTDGYRPRIAQLNRILADFPQKYDFLRFLDIGAHFLDDKGNLPRSLMNDGVHPTEKGYTIWADALRPLLFPEPGK